MLKRLVPFVFLSGGFLPGCAVGPKYQPPTPSVPETWNEAGQDGLVSNEASAEAWWQVFGDEKLSDLIRRAAEGNLDVRAAVLRIREARALRGIAAGELLPSLAGSSVYERSKASANGPAAGLGVPDRATQFTHSVAQGMAASALSQQMTSAAPGASALTGPVANALAGMMPGPHALPETDETDLFANGFDAAWEVDVFGGIRRNVEAADATLCATVENYRAVLVSLSAEVATTYIDLRALQSQLASTQRNMELQRETLQLTQSRYEAELTSELDVRQAQTNLATTESELPLLETGIAVAIYRLSVLLGLEPAALYEELCAEQPIPHATGETLVGVPADLLRRRPDLRAAERRLAAQTALIGVAAAELYPRFTLSGTFAFEATDFNHMLDARSVSYGLGPAVRWNIFDGLRNLNRIAAQEAVTHQAYVTYEQTLLLALENVESSMVAYKREQTRWEALERAVEAAQQTVQLAETRYRNGLTDFQNVVSAERSLAVLENSLAQSRGQVAVNLVSVYKSLGGGWSPNQTPQAQYWDAKPAALADPVQLFTSGGKVPLPWAADSGKQSATTNDSQPQPETGTTSSN